MSEYLLSTSGLTKQFGHHKAVNNVDLHVKKGAIYGFIGRNGAGKTTFLKMISGLSKPTDGEIQMFGYRNEELKNVRSRISCLIEAPGIYGNMSAYHNLAIKCRLFGINDSKYIENILKIVGLSEVGKKKTKHFSLGMKQRLGIAQAMLNDPRILILDEPTAGLDPKERVRFRNLISAFSKDRIVILSTHIVSDVEFIAEEIIMMKSGQIIHFGNPQEITSEIDGQVWECTVPTAYAEKYAAAYNTSNLRNISGNQTILRIIGNRPPMENAVRVQPTLEDLYLFYFKGGCEE